MHISERYVQKECRKEQSSKYKNIQRSKCEFMWCKKIEKMSFTMP